MLNSDFTFVYKSIMISQYQSSYTKYVYILFSQADILQASIYYRSIAIIVGKHSGHNNDL